VVEPRAYPIEPILAVHDADYVDFIRTVNSTPIDDPEIPEGCVMPLLLHVEHHTPWSRSCSNHAHACVGLSDRSKPAPVAYPFTFPYVRPGLSKHRSRSIIAQMGRYVFDLSTPINSDTYPVRLASPSTRALRAVRPLLSLP
jgi:acetoin utilization deacetylase AcuC-like enzyme